MVIASGILRVPVVIRRCSREKRLLVHKLSSSILNLIKCTPMANTYKGWLGDHTRIRVKN